MYLLYFSAVLLVFILKLLCSFFITCNFLSPLTELNAQIAFTEKDLLKGIASKLCIIESFFLNMYNVEYYTVIHH